MKTKKFVRQENKRYSKLGSKRKKLQKWRKPKGRDSKMRLKKKSHLTSPTVGHKSPKKTVGKINGMKPVLVHNLKELNALEKNAVAILARLGMRKRLELIKQANEKNLRFLNVRGDKK